MGKLLHEKRLTFWSWWRGFGRRTWRVLWIALVLLGILLGVAIALGMALTITTVVLIAVAGKNLTAGIAVGHSGRRHHLEHAIQSMAGLAVALLGGLFLASAIAA